MKYKSPTTPMEHQTEYLRRLKKRPDSPSSEDVMAVLGEMGTGKSYMILTEWQNAVSAGTMDDLMVIAPSGSYRNWFEDKSNVQPSELRAHLDPKLLEKLVVLPWITGSAKARRRLETMTENPGTEPRAMFVNIEAISSTDDAASLCEKFLAAPGRRSMLVIDESTKIKSGRAERTKVIVKRLRALANARRIVTGWITPKSPLDLYWQFFFLDWRILDYESPLGFRNKYAVTEKQCFLPNDLIRAKLLSSMGVRKGESTLSDARLRGKLAATRLHLEQESVVPPTMPRLTVIRKLEEEAAMMRRDDMIDLIPKLGGYVQVVEKIKEFRNLEELQGKIAPYSFRVLKSECLDLPPKVYEIRDVALTAEQRRVYDEVKQYATSELSDGVHVTTESVITQMIRLHQIVCGHVVDEEGTLRDVDSRRIPDLLDLLEDYDGKAIIWTTYQHEIRKTAAALREQYGPRSTAMFYGGNKRTRVDDEKKFLGDPECRWMVSTQAAGGMGNTWTVANLVVYAANSYDLEHRVQSEDRAHRKGQTKSVTYVDMMARGTVEEKIVAALRQKINLTTAVTGENFREWLI